MSIENGDLHKLDFTSLIKDFPARKSRKRIEEYVPIYGCIAVSYIAVMTCCCFCVYYGFCDSVRMRVFCSDAYIVAHLLAWKAKSGY